MTKTTLPELPSNDNRKWYIVDAADKPLGRLAVKVANVLRGKDKADFAPSVDTGAFVIVINAQKVALTGKKNEQKQYVDFTGWRGGLSKTPANVYRITGRLKDMIIRGGENIYPKEIEEFIYTHPETKDVQVIGVPDKKYGEEIMACIILKNPGSVTVEEMSNYIKASMARHKVPKYIEFVDSFPMNAAGKVLKYKMREDAAKRLGLVGDGSDTAGPGKS